MAMKTRSVLLLGAIVIAVRLLLSGNLLNPSGSRSTKAAPSTRQSIYGDFGDSKSGSGLGVVRLPDELNSGRTHTHGRHHRHGSNEIVQVEVTEEELEGLEPEGIVSAARPKHKKLPGSAQEEEDSMQDQGQEGADGDGADDATGEGGGSWQGEQEARWRALLRPDMEVLVTREAIHRTIEVPGKGGRPTSMVVFKFRDHKGSLRELQWEESFTDAANLPMRDWHFSSDPDPPSGTRTRHKSCALVGNSGVMKGSKMGREIDAHDAVVRINYAPTNGFEGDVGSKTTYDLLNKENCMKLAKGEHHFRSPKSTAFLFESHSRIIRSQVYIKLLGRAPVKSGEQAVLVLQPALITASRAIYLMIKGEVEDEINSVRLAWGSTGQLNLTKMHSLSPYVANAVKRAGAMRPGDKKFHFNNKPMSGMAALFLCIQMCNKITMYGFNAFLDKRKQRYHYFDEREGMTDVHSFDLAMEVFRRIGQEYPLDVRE